VKIKPNKTCNSEDEKYKLEYLLIEIHGKFYDLLFLNVEKLTFAIQFPFDNCVMLLLKTRRKARTMLIQKSQNY
jgi:hypothetical protein